MKYDEEKKEEEQEEQKKQDKKTHLIQRKLLNGWLIEKNYP